MTPPSVPTLQAPPALCHPLHHPPGAIPFARSPPEGLPCAPRQRVGVQRPHRAGLGGIPWGRDTARSLLGFPAGSAAQQRGAPGAGLGGRRVPGIPPAPMGGRGVKPAESTEKQIKLFPFSRNDCLPNYSRN